MPYEIKERTIVKGGEFIIKENNSQDVFTPEDFTDEQVLMKESVQEFINREILPNKDVLKKRIMNLQRNVCKRLENLDF